MELTFNNQVVKVNNHNKEPYFYGSHVAKLLAYNRPGNALETHVSPENTIHMRNLDSGLRTLINEIGIYELIFSSKLPLAKEFRNFSSELYNRILESN